MQSPADSQPASLTLIMRPYCERNEMQKVIIDSEFKSLIPRLTADEFQQLEKNIQQDGCRDPIVVWDGILIDGHNRYEICNRLGISFNTIELNFASRDDVIVWMIDNQDGRRNIQPFHRTELQLRKKSILAAKAKQNQILSGGNRYIDVQDSFIDKAVLSTLTKAVPADTRKEIASAAKVSQGTVHKVETVIKKAEPKIIDAARAGVISVNLASQVAELPKEVQAEVASAPADEIKKAAVEAVKKAHVANNSGNNEWYTPEEYIDAARSVMGSIDTDPATSLIANKVVKAKTIYTAEDDGRDKTWHGNVWMNPPYAQPLIADFSEAVSKKFDDKEIDQACILVNNATETAWFQRMLKSASAVCFPKSRIRFLDPLGNPGAPLQGQAIIYFGNKKDEFIAAFSSKGSVLIK